MPNNTPATVELEAKDTTGAIKQFFKSLFWWQWSLTAIITIAIVVGLVFATVEATKPKPLTNKQKAELALKEEWKRWNKSYTVDFKNANADTAVVAQSLSANTATTADFNNLDADALALAGLQSPSTYVNGSVATLATDLQQVASDGLAVYAGGGSITTFENDIQNAETQLANTQAIVEKTSRN